MGRDAGRFGIFAVIAAALIFALAGASSSALAGDCHARHYCMICRGAILLSGDSPPPVPVAEGAPPVPGRVCPFSRNMPEDRRCSDGEIRQYMNGRLREGLATQPALQAPQPYAVDPNVPEATYGRAAAPKGAAPRQPASVPAPDAEEALAINVGSIPKEVVFGAPLSKLQERMQAPHEPVIGPALEPIRQLFP